MKRIIAVAVCSLVALVAPPFVGALAQSPVTELQIESVDVSAYPEVSLTVSVPAHEDGPRDPDAFTVTENGAVRDADIAYADSSDLQIVMLIDTTGSMGGTPLAGAKVAATTFLERLPDDVAVAVLSYDVETVVITDFSADREEHIAGIDGLVAEGRTATYDAVLTAVEMFSDSDDTRRAIVLLTDGEDNASESSVEDAVDALVDADITLHSVEYLTAFTDEDAIRGMANATGGSVLEAADAQALTQVYEDLAAALVSRYTVRYTSDADGDVDVAVAVDHDGLQAADTRTVSMPEAEPDERVDGEETPDVAVPTAPPPPTIPPMTEIPTGRMELVGGATLWFVALAIFVLLFLAPRSRRVRLAASTPRLGGGQRKLTAFANQATLVAERTLERRGYRSGLNTALERAGISLRPGEFIVLVVSAGIAAFAVGLVLQGWVAATILTLVTIIAARLIVSLLIGRRQRRFADQLGETLQLLSGSLRAGYSLMQAVDAVAREADSPAAEEFGRLVVETRLGRDMTTALEALADRMQCEDFTWVMQAIEIHREVGGDLAEVLDTVAGTIRERNQIRRQVAALSAEGRLSAYVLLALPFGVGSIIFVTNRSYLAELTHGGLLGWGLIGIGAALMVVGVIWMRKLVKLEF